MSDDPIGLYVHLPWCTRKCPYCDFNSHLAPPLLAERDYIDALLADLDGEIDSGPTPPVASIFIGGGTPSLFSGEAIARLLAGIAARQTLVADIEITLEANPGSAEVGRFAAYRAAGVNRLSLGIQSFEDACLAALGRVHDAAAARRAIEGAASAGFDNLNLDLMFGLPGASPGASLTDLEQAIAVRPAHLSWYQLTIEEGTAFARKPPLLPDHDSLDDEHQTGLDRLAAAGYRRYEVSAFAQPGRRARHNLNYWSYGDYLGIGAGAHGKRTGRDGRIHRRVKVRHPDRYMKTAVRGQALESEHVVDGDDRVLEFMLNALRLSDGFDLDDFVRRTGVSADATALTLPVAAAVQRGWLACADRRVLPTALGYRFLNDLLLLFVNPTGDSGKLVAGGEPGHRPVRMA